MSETDKERLLRHIAASDLTAVEKRYLERLVHGKHGKWIETEPDEEDRKIGIDFRIECSECHDENSHITTNDSHEITGKVFWRSKFCPNCGAKMCGGADDVD